ncbi:Uncharacterised protein [Legionella steigerwaltii]|uniref:Uncharacterized protein n=1 Tax=Legionella steigerwaltii TaxID=460 RepID=A0A378L9R4_9GAMM|nr:hypothetical protein [Legionella steigerwaltii]KTD77482.1 hypothetical protein Lstg_1839 [Legionella steigerwaltii]STY22662.1 Uncharacterised protein [Legionella steigerwaltii]
MDSKIEKQPFTLTMLGTLTDFTPELKQTRKPTPYTKGSKVKDYPKGETLSIISSLIKTSSPANTTKGDLKNPYPFQADEIAVVNGPKTDGANVGEKIALGLAAVLKAIARGQTSINIIAHSRGVVESILIAHELEAIQKMVATCASFEEVLKHLTEQQTKRHKGTPTNNTPDIIEVLKSQINQIPKEDQEQWFNLLKTSLPNASINLFGVDPVPGDCFPITWYDERFFILPQIIKNTELIFYANERSDWGFTPICPEVVSKETQNYVRYSMPGHHGTGSTGNNGSQQGIIVCPNGYKTTHVQKLMIYKILNFLSRHHVEFNDGTQIFHQYSALGRKYLGDDTETKSINLSSLDFPTILRKLYAIIAKNQIGYDAYNLTYYSYMGLTKQRKILNKGHVYGLFNDVFTTYSGYVNEEHALLMQAHFFKIFGLDTQRKNLADLINTANLVLEENIKKIASKEASIEASILDSEVNRKNVLETFGVVIRQVSQQYLTDDWSPIEKEKEKEDLYQAIIDILTKFKELSKSDNLTIRQYVAELLLLSFTSINHTLVVRAQGIKKDFKYLQESIDNRLTKFFSELLMQLNHTENSPSVILSEIINSEEYKKLPNHPSAIKITHIYKQLSGKGLEKYSIEQLTKSYEEQFANTIEDFAKLYQQIRIFIYDLAALRSIVPSEKIEVDELHLLKQANGLIATAAERFYKDRPYALPPIAETEFMKLAERHAIEHLGVVDRLKEKNKEPEKTTVEASSGWFSFFWSPVSRMVYGTQVNTTSNGDIIPKEGITSTPS